MLTTVRQAFRMLGTDHRGRWWWLIALAISVSGLEMVGAVMVYVLLELVVNPDGAIELPLLGDVRRFASDMDHDTLLLAVIVTMAAFFAFRAVVKVGAKYVQYRVAHNAGVRLAQKLVAGYLHLPYSAHLRRNSSELIRNAHQAIDEMVAGVFIPIIKVAAESVLTIGMLAVLITIAPTATLLAVVIVGGAAAVLLRVIQPKLKRVGRTAHRNSQQSLRSVQQALHGIRDVKTLGREAYFARQYGNYRMKYARARYLRSAAGALPPVVIETALLGFILAFFGVAIAMGSGSEAVLSTLGLFGYAGLRLQPSLQGIIGGLNEIKHATAPLDDLYADLQATSSLPQKSETVVALPFTDALRLEDVSFCYEGADHPALREINLTIRRGEEIGICGMTGGGKTTLVDIITGLLEPTMGRVTVDGVDIRDRHRSWQRNLGVVPQMVFLIDDTLRRNIALGIPDDQIDEQALNEAVQLAQLMPFVESLPEGLESTVGERGVRLSGGQRQRISIARALYRRPEVLVFDEGTSALDNTTEVHLMHALDSLRGDRTIILIAHRLTTVQHSDKVVFIEGGRIAGLDTYDTLSKENERFRELIDLNPSGYARGPLGRSAR